MKSIATNSKNWDFILSLRFINLNMASTSGMGYVWSVFNLNPCVMKPLWCGIASRCINSFLWVYQIPKWYPADLVLTKHPQEKNQVGSNTLCQHCLHILRWTIPGKMDWKRITIITWPARSPDLTPPDFSCEGLVRTRCTGHQYMIWQT